ncbi:hypothetical protein QR680_009910 [Steinernema hermaphroditum]|uniref:Peptidase M13 C-terminal domain-containing protein n=1 Tax=Steinernema hermaphroditum TaxID=289476 RepID=A0AA39IM29_9BILA|nr:hypothetical protein QR680_009910 [Steinernema hermaphroditum]
MFRSRTLVVLMILFIGASNLEALFLQPLDTRIKPCQNLYMHVCGKASTDGDTSKAVFENALSDEAIEVIANMRDPIFDLIVMIVKNGGYRNPRDCSAEKLGRVDSLGKAIAYGKVKDVTMNCRHSAQTCRLSSRSLSYGEFIDCPYDAIEKTFGKNVKKLVDNYLELIDVDRKMKNFTFSFKRFNIFNAAENNLINGLGSFTEADLHERLFKCNRFSPYFNLAYSKMLLENDIYVSGKGLEELKDMYRLLMNEILEKVNNSAVVSPKSRDTINNFFRKDVKAKIGLPEEFYNTAVIQKHMDGYRQHLKGFDTRGECQLEMLAREIHLVRNRFIFANEKRINQLSGTDNHEETVHEHNAYYNGKNIFLLPSYIHIVKKELSIGMKYGIIAATMAHEIFHGLGLERGDKRHLKEVRRTPLFREAIKCYRDYFGSFCTTDSKHVECPNGNKKKEEGFADVEGARVAISVLKKLLASKTGRHTRSGIRFPRFSAVPLEELKTQVNYDELQWFFVGLALQDCSTADDRTLFNSFKDVDHPRNSIRSNAIAMQMREFTEVFNCRCEDDMHHEELCEGYPPAGRRAMTVFLLLGVIFVTFLVYHLRSLQRKDLPPGPKPWPILGNFPTVIIAGWRGIPVMEILKQWKKEYGNCYTFWLGPIPTVHVVDYKTAVDAFVRNAEVHAGRMQIWQYAETRGNKGIVFSEGPEWQEQRRFSLHVLRNFGVGRNLMQERILEEVKYRFEDLESEIRSAGGRKTMNLAPLFDLLKHEAEFFHLKHQLDQQLSESAIIDNFILTPTTIKWPFFKNRWEKQRAPDRATQGYIRKLISDRLEAIANDTYHLDDSGDGNDYIDAYLIEMNRRKANGEDMGWFSIENLVHNMMDLWIAGMETTVITLLWAFIYFLNHPDAQDRLREEIYRTTRGERLVELSDRVAMPFAHAVAIEVQRTARIGNFNLFHRTTAETVIDGHVLPKGTITVPQVSVIMHDDGVFQNPDQFDPDRYFKGDRKTLEQNVVAFGFGKRACLGEGLAKAELFLIIMNMVQRFKVSTVPGGDPPSLKAVSEGSSLMHRPRPYNVQIEVANY